MIRLDTSRGAPLQWLLNALAGSQADSETRAPSPCRLLYTPALEPHEFTDRALILDTERVGSGPLTEIVEVALGDTNGNIMYQTLVRPVFNPLPPQSKHKRFARAEFAQAPEWPQV